MPGCEDTNIQAAHVRYETDGSMGVKPSDRWAISLCYAHHAQQGHQGEVYFERVCNIDMKALAEEFANHPDSPWRRKFGGK